MKFARTVSLLVVMLAFDIEAHAQVVDCSGGPADATWCKETGASILNGSGLTRLSLGRVLVNAGGTIHALQSSDGAVIGDSSIDVSTVASQMPYQFSPGNEALFVTTTGGLVYRLNADGSCVWRTLVSRTDLTTIHDVGCVNPALDTASTCPGDQVTSTPAVRPGADEASTTVIMGTRYTTTGPGACRNVLSNRVYALNAATGAPMWVMNEASGNETTPSDFRARQNSTRAIPFIAGGGAPEFWDSCGEAAQDRIWFATNGDGAPNGQPNLIAARGDGSEFSTYRLGGQGLTLRFLASVVRSYHPSLCGRIYMASYTFDRVVAIGTTVSECAGAAPCLLWQSNGQFNEAVSRDFVFNNQTGQLYLTGDDGNLYVLTDNGPTVTFDCMFDADGVVSSSPSFANGFIYAGLSVGMLGEGAADCSSSSVKTFSVEPGTTLSRPFVDSSPGSSNSFLIVGNDSGRVVRLDLPLP